MENQKLKFFDFSLDLMCTATLDFRYEHLNPAWQETLGWTADELRSHHVMDFVHPDDLNYTQKMGAQMVSSNSQNAVGFENRYRHKKGHYIWLSWNATVSDGRFFAIARNVTKIKQQEAALSSALSELRLFAYAASHDLKEPLRTISSHLGILAENEEFSPDSQSSFDFALDASSRMDSMLGGLLLYSRLDSSGENRERVVLANVLERAAQSFPGLAFSSGSLPVIVAVESQIERLVQNILANALRYRSQDRAPCVEVVAFPGTSSDTITLEFRDNGVGIRAGQEERALQMFGRCHPRSAYPEGQGVGLALCKRIAEQHGGSIKLSNNDNGVGLTTTVTLGTQ